jgi:hypothetical protein
MICRAMMNFSTEWIPFASTTRSPPETSKHFDDPLCADDAFGNACKKAVAGEVIQPVDVELTCNQLGEVFFRMCVVVDFHAGSKGTSENPAQPFEEKRGDLLMMDALNDRIFEGVRKRAVADIVEQDGNKCALCIFSSNNMSPGFENGDGFLHQVHGSQRMLETGVQGSGIDQVGQSELFDAAQTLEIGMLNQVEDESARDVYKPVDRVVDYFPFLLHRLYD